MHTQNDHRYLDTGQSTAMVPHHRRESTWQTVNSDELLFWLLCLLAGFMFTRIHFNSTLESARASLSALAAGTAAKPYQCRVLAPLVARGLVTVLPLDWRIACGSVEFAAVVGLLAAYRRLLVRLFSPSRSFLYALLLLYPMLWNLCLFPRHYSPDPVPAALFLVLGVNALLDRRLLTFYLIYLLACLNRETALVLAVASALFRPQGETWRATFARTGLLVGTWVCVMVCLSVIFLSNRGARFGTPHWRRNLALLWDLVRLRGDALPFLFILGGAWAPALVAWRRLDGLAKRLALLGVCTGLGMFFLDFAQNTANYSELIPCVFTASLVWLDVGRRREEGDAACEPCPAQTSHAWLGRVLPTLSLLVGSRRSIVVRARALPWRWLLLCALLSYTCVRVHARATVDFVVGSRSLLCAGQALRPFQYRVLVPFLGKWLAWATIMDLRASLNAINTLAVFVLVVSYRALLQSVVGERLSYMLNLAILAPILCNYCALGDLYYPSDLPAITFFVLGALCIQQRRWGLYYLLFVLATLNRETCCFLTFLLLFTQWRRMRSSALVGHCAAQLVIWAAIKALLAWRFQANDGVVMFENQVSWNLAHLAMLLTLRPTVLQYLLTFGLAWAAVPWAWRDLPDFHRRALFVALPFFASMSIVGRLTEVRIHGELVPVVTTAAVVWFVNGPGKEWASTAEAARGPDSTLPSTSIDGITRRHGRG